MNDHLLLVILLITQWARVFTPGVCMIQFRWFFVHLWVPSLSLVFVASTWIKYHHTCTNDKVYIYIKMMSAWIIKRFPGAKKQPSTTSCTKTELEVVFRGARGNRQHASIQVRSKSQVCATSFDPHHLRDHGDGDSSGMRAELYLRELVTDGK